MKPSRRQRSLASPSAPTAAGSSPARPVAAWRELIRQRLSLQEDKASDEAIDQTLRQGVEMRGTNLWVLVFAIFVASIGLNVNSTAVIIGAMLISPLMGPIMGIGYGVGIHDFALIRESFKNLGLAVLLALITSTLYFLISPLDGVQSELLARTTPTIWDVLIALVGGLAGIVGVTRKEKSNVIPGVAIATALMPPLCTAGFGLANGEWSFFFGAFYLFAINSVFIALAAALVTRGLHVRETSFVDSRTALRVRHYVTVVVVVTVLPSVYLAYQLVQEEVFKSRAARFVATEFNFKRSHVTQTQIDAKQQSIDVTLVGEYVAAERLATIADRLGGAGLSGARLDVHQADENKVDVTALKTGLLSDLYTQSQKMLEARDQTIADLRRQLDGRAGVRQQLAQVPRELQALFPQVQAMWLAPDALYWQASVDAPVAAASAAQPDRAASAAAADGQVQTEVVAHLVLRQAITPAERARLLAWLQARLAVSSLRLETSQQR